MSAILRTVVRSYRYFLSPLLPPNYLSPVGYALLDPQGKLVLAGQTDPNLPLQTKYPAQNSNVVLADGIEARLIEAEARLQGATQADRDAMFASLNTLRATGLAAAIAPLPASPATQDAAVDMLFKERAFWMWLTGHRMGDMRRLIRQYKRDQATVFPVGAMPLRRGESFGTDVNFVVPFNERNNPKFAGCIDRNP